VTTSEEMIPYKRTT